VPAIRTLLAQRRLAFFLCGATLLLKLLVPTGYMIGSEQGRPAIIMCPAAMPPVAVAGMAGMHGDMADHGKSMDHGAPRDHGKPEMPCAFSALSAPALDTIDPIQLAALIAFVMAIGLAGVALPPPSRPAYLRPPLRGPPATL
jgi:hypothetical protein